MTHSAISQTTSALSYIIIKTILFFNINSILDLIEKVQLRLHTSESINLYETLLLNILEKKDYVKILNDNFYIKADRKKFVGKTMRMSVY